MVELDQREKENNQNLNFIDTDPNPQFMYQCDTRKGQGVNRENVF